MVVAGGGDPIAALGIEPGQEKPGVAGIGLRVEGRLEVGEGLRVVIEVHLHATDIDDPYAAFLQGADLGDRLLLGGEELALALGIDGPGPGPAAAARFDPADGVQQALRQLVVVLGDLDRPAAHPLGRDHHRLRRAEGFHHLGRLGALFWRGLGRDCGQRQKAEHDRSATPEQTRGIDHPAGAITM